MTIIVITMILTRLTAKSSGRSAQCQTTRRKLAYPVNLGGSVQSSFHNGLKLENLNGQKSLSEEAQVYVTRNPRPISGAKSLINERWLR